MTEEQDHIYIRVPAEKVEHNPVNDTYMVDLGLADDVVKMVLGAMVHPGMAVMMGEDEEEEED